jgi:hypothetical protein
MATPTARYALTFAYRCAFGCDGLVAIVSHTFQEKCCRACPKYSLSSEAKMTSTLSDITTNTEKNNANETSAATQPATIQIDESKLQASYANFCRVTGTPEELIIDFGLNPQPFGVPTQPIPVTQQIVTNFYTGKRMLQALQMTIQRHEAAFGVLETDVQKRIRPMTPKQ